MPNQYSHAIPPTGDVLFPEDLANLGGPLVAGQAELISLSGDRGVGFLTFVESRLTWLDDFELFVFQVLADGTRKAIRKATSEDIKEFRVPISIQGEEFPICIWLDPVDRNRPKIELHDGQEVLIGKGPQCQVVLGGDSTVGRMHCFISHRDGVTLIQDLGTRYGVSVNGRCIDRASLAPGDLVRIGKVEEFVVRGRHGELADA
jgi:FHA domain